MFVQVEGSSCCDRCWEDGTLRLPRLRSRRSLSFQTILTRRPQPVARRIFGGERLRLKGVLARPRFNACTDPSRYSCDRQEKMSGGGWTAVVEGISNLIAEARQRCLALVFSTNYLYLLAAKAPGYAIPQLSRNVSRMRFTIRC